MAANVAANKLGKEAIFEYIKVNNPFGRPDSFSRERKTIFNMKIQNELMYVIVHDAKDRQWMFHHVKIQSGKKTEIALPIGTDNIAEEMFVDPTGCHCIVTTRNGLNLYVNTKYLKPHVLSKFQGIKITTISWNFEFGIEADTGFIGIGTVNGTIFESSISAAGVVSYFKPITTNISNSKEPLLPITKMYMFMIAGTENGKDRWILFVCLPGQLHIFDGYLNTTEILRSYNASLAEPVLSRLFVNDGPVPHRFFQQGPHSCSNFVLGPTELERKPRFYCWIKEEGISVGTVKLAITGNSYDFIDEKCLIPHESIDGLVEYPKDVVQTEWHYFLLYKNRIQALSVLDQKPYFTDERYASSTVSVCRDASSQMIWAHNDRAIWKYRPTREDRYVWQIFTQQGRFSEARLLTSQLADPGPLRSVIIQEGDFLIDQKNFSKAAECFAESTESFHAIVNRFLSLQDPAGRSGLERYLQLRMERERDPIRIKVLVLWFVDLALTDIYEAQNDTTGTRDEREARLALKNFLCIEKVLKCANESKDVLYRQAMAHIDFDSYTLIANLLNDHDALIRVYVLRKDFKGALEVLRQSKSSELYYKYANDLLPVLPDHFVRAIEDNRTLLHPSGFLPAFYRLVEDPLNVPSALKFFERSIKENRATKAIHSFVILLYAEHTPEKLLAYLKGFGTVKENVPYDTGNALRLCVRKNLLECCVFLYRLEGMYESAVTVALQIDLNLAKECAKDVGFDPNDFLRAFDVSAKLPVSEDIQRHLWLLIATHMIENGSDAAAVMTIIKESNNIVSIHDLLSRFPHFTNFEALKKPLCECLTEMSKQIGDVKGKIKDAGEIITTIKRDMVLRQKQYRIVKASDECYHCKQKLIIKGFFSFNCGHFFHRKCLEEHLLAVVSGAEKARLKKLIDARERLSMDNSVKAKNDLAVVNRHLTDLVATECPLCGTRAISLIDKPFFTDEEYAEQVAQWQVGI